MRNATIPARPKTSQLNSPQSSSPGPLPHWVIVAGFGSYVTQCRAGRVPSQRPSFRGLGLELWQIRWLEGEANPEAYREYQRKRKAARREKRASSPEASPVTLAGLIATRKAVRS